VGLGLKLTHDFSVSVEISLSGETGRSSEIVAAGLQQTEIFYQASV
jgi:hypothetical protein